MEQNNKGPNGLPTEYQVQCPSPIPKEWTELMTKAAPENGHKSGGASGAYVKVTGTRYNIDGDKWPDTPEISYEDWKKALTEPQQDLQIESLKGKNVAIQCNTQEEWDAICKLIPKCRLKPGEWKIYPNNSIQYCSMGGTFANPEHWQEYKNFKIVQAKDVIAANQPSTVYKVGDWITVLDGGCRVGPGIHGHTLVGNSYQISSVDRQTPTEWKYTLEGNPAQTSAIVWDKATMGSQSYIRLATAEEIAKATGKPLPTESKEWVPKVGGWMWTDVQRYASRGKAVQIVNISKDHPERLLLENGGWFEKKDARPATPEEIRKAQSKNSKEWICTSEDGVELYDGNNGYWIENDQCGWEYKTSCTVCKGHVDPKQSGALTKDTWKVFSTEQAAKEWIARQSTIEQIPVTADNAYVGMKVVMTDEVRKRGGDKEVYIGEIIDWYDTGRGVSVKWPIGCKAGKNYTWGNLYIAPEEKSTNKSIINSQTKTKTNSYEHKEHNKQQDSSSSICKGSNLRTKVKEYEGQQPARGESVVSIRKIKPKIVEGGY